MTTNFGIDASLSLSSVKDRVPRSARGIVNERGVRRFVTRAFLLLEISQNHSLRYFKVSFLSLQVGCKKIGTRSVEKVAASVRTTFSVTPQRVLLLYIQS